MARMPQLYAIPRAQNSQASSVDNPFSDRSVPSVSEPDRHDQQQLQTPATNDDRNSANLSSIGGLLLGGGGNNKPLYRDEEEYVGVDKNSLHARVMRDMVDSAYEPAYDEPTPNYELYDDKETRASRSLNKADYDAPPAPSPVPAPGTPTRAQLPKLQMPSPQTPTRQYAQLGPHGPPTPSTPTHPNGHGAPMGHPMFTPVPHGVHAAPHGGHGGQGNLQQPQPHRPMPKVLIPHDTGTVVPPNTLPVAPMLAAPPRAHFSPMTPPASPSSKAIGAIEANLNSPLSGFDRMREKGTCFREGEDEVLTSFSPRITGDRPRARVAGPHLNPSGRKSAFRPLSTVDFWKRMSVVAKTHDPNKESDWMKSKKRSIWKNPMFVVPLVLTILAVIAIVAWGVHKVQNTESQMG